MKKKTQMPNKLLTIYLVLVLLISLHCFGQTKQQPKKEVSPVRQIAIQTLESALDETRQVDNLEQRIKLTENIVELLLRERPNKCRQAVESLFDEVLSRKSSSENNEKLIDSIGAVIRIAALLDKKLAQKFVEQNLEKEAEFDSTKNENDKSQNQANLSLQIASQLISKEPVLAAKVAENALAYEISDDLLLFLVNLKKTNELIANDFAMKALQAIENRKAQNINELFLLYSYVFISPQVPFIESGRPVYFPSFFALTENKNVNRTLANNFLQKSVRLLLNRERFVSGSLLYVKQGELGDYFFLKTIEPLLKLYAPNLQDSVMSRQAFLFQFLEQEKRASWQNSIKNFAVKKNEKSTMPTKERLLEKAEVTEDSKQKDYYFYEAAMIALKHEEFDETLKIIERMSEDSDQTLKPYIKYVMAQKLAGKSRFSEAEEIAKRDEDKIRSVSLFVLIAKIALQKNNSDSLNTANFLHKAEDLSEKLESREKAISLFAISAVYAEFDFAQAVDKWREGVTAANKVENYSGEEIITRNFPANGFQVFYKLFTDEMSSQSILTKISSPNFLNSLTDVIGIKNRLFRLKSIISLCRPIMKAA